MKALWLSVLGSLTLLAAPIAHHGDADRYTEQVITISGTAAQLRMINPHAAAGVYQGLEPQDGR